MPEEKKARTIAAPPPRTTPAAAVAPSASTGAAAGLFAANRTVTPPPAAATTTRAPAPVPTVRTPDAAPVQPIQVANAATSSDVPAGVPRVRRHTLTFAIPLDLDRRIKAAFVATQYDEGWETFAGMMEELVLAEARRLEEVYNNGLPFPTERKLKRGRPFA